MGGRKCAGVRTVGSASELRTSCDRVADGRLICKADGQLITMVKTAQDDGPVPTFTDYSILEGKSAGHKNFNKRVGFVVDLR